jgi:hypothetical protein
MEALEIYSPDTPSIRRDNGLLTPPHKQTHIHAVQCRHNTATYQYREDHTLWADSVRGFPLQESTWYDHPSVCYCLERWFLTRPVHRDAWIYVQSRRLDGRNPDKSKVLGSSQTAWDQVTPNFTDSSPISNAFCADGTPSIGHSLEFPSPRVIGWHRGFYTSREMTGRVRFSFRLSGISILAFKRTPNTK